jgi:photosystem II stability/assembly factor-like uncharacterized protein
MLRFFSLIFIFTSQICFSQWEFQNPTPTGFNLTEIVKINNTSALVLGRENTILKSTNKGANWINFYLGDTTTFNNAYIFNDNNFIVVGNNGQIARTSNGGTNWVKSTVSNLTMRSVKFIDANTGFIVGTFGGVLKTTDGGTNWTQISFNFNFSDIFVHNPAKLIAYTNFGSVYYSTNGGTNWVITDYLLNGLIRSMQFINSTTGYFCNADNKIYKTTNEGINWVQSGTTPVSFVQMYFKDPANVFACSQTDTSFYYSTNSGNNWSKIPFTSGNFLKRFVFFDDGSSAGITTTYRIFNTNNYLFGWNNVSMDFFNFVPNNILNNLNFQDNNNGLISCTNGIFVSSNGGATWIYKYIGENISVGKSVFVPGTSNFIAIGKEGSPDQSPRIFRSTNNGLTWLQSVFPYSQYSYLNDIVMINSLTGFICESGTSSKGLLKTTNGGINWFFSLQNDSLSPGRIVFNNNHGALFTIKNIIVTADYGSTWSYNFYVGTGRSLRDIKFSGNTLYAFSDSIGTPYPNYKVHKSTDFGNTWTWKTIPDISDYVSSLVMTDENVGFVLGNGGNLFSTNNYFQTVKKVYNQRILSATFISPGFFFLNQNTGWVCSSSGVVLKTTNSGGVIGIRKIETTVLPKEFTLYNNYPNPFNPITTIKFNLPRTTNVELKIFDMQGRETELLINEQLLQGTYEYTFNAEKLPSGVYFYQLKTSSGNLTKKMILVK